MGLEQVRVGVGLTASFCTFHSVEEALKSLTLGLIDGRNPAYTFVLSENTQQLPNRFCTKEDLELRLMALSPHPLIKTIPDAEPLGPQNLLDVFVIAPCTGNTLAKLANGITDSPVLMAAKGHLRNGKPLVISLATNDALGNNLRNIGTLFNAKNIYFVPFSQDSPEKKPFSLIANTALLGPAIASALRGEQLQPVLVNQK